MTSEKVINCKKCNDVLRKQKLFYEGEIIQEFCHTCDKIQVYVVEISFKPKEYEKVEGK